MNLEQYLPSKESDDRASPLHRQALGYTGLLLPWVVLFLGDVRPTTDLAGRPSSLSAYYYTGANAAFVGFFVALAAYLLTYKGFDNGGQKADQWLARIAGAACLLLAFYPTGAPPDVAQLQWWKYWPHGVLHFVAAATMFVAFIGFCLFMFPRTRPGSSSQPTEKKVHNGVYYLCGAVMIVCLAWAGLAVISSQPVFLPEFIAIEAFAVSWLAKGKADETFKIAVGIDPKQPAKAAAPSN